MTDKAGRLRRRLHPLVWAIIAVGTTAFVGANAHLIYVAFKSQPACVPHVKENTGEAGQFKAANSAC